MSGSSRKSIFSVHCAPYKALHRKEGETAQLDVGEKNWRMMKGDEGGGKKKDIRI